MFANNFSEHFHYRNLNTGLSQVKKKKFHCVDILELKVFTKGNLDTSLYHSINLTILSTARKKRFDLQIFLGMKRRNCSVKTFRNCIK